MARNRSPIAVEASNGTAADAYGGYRSIDEETLDFTIVPFDRFETDEALFAREVELHGHLEPHTRESFPRT